MSEPPYRQGFPADVVKTYINESNNFIDINEIRQGDLIRIWLRPRWFLERQIICHKLRFVALNRGNSFGKLRGNQLTHFRGGVSSIDFVHNIFVVDISPGANGFPNEWRGQAEVPFTSILRSEIVRDRFSDDGTEQLVRYPKIYTVAYIKP
jgi:hypothetical protein